MPGGAAAAVNCAICGRTLLVGEDTTRFSPDGIEYLDVCPLCRGHAMEAGWYREGDTSLPVMAAAPRRGFFARLMGAPQASPPPVAQPILSRLSPDEQAIVEAVALFNGSPHRRTIEGLMRSLGTPRAAVDPTETGDTGIVVSGRSPGTATASRPTPPTLCRWSNVASTPPSWAPSTTGTPTSTPRDGLCRELRPSNRSKRGYTPYGGRPRLRLP